QQVEGELLGLHGQALVLLRDRIQVVQAAGELAVLVAQHLELVAGQRCRQAFLAWYHHADRQVRELLQDLRMQPQPRRDFVGTEFFGGFAHCSHSPSNTNAVGPDIRICASSPGQAIRSSPPGSATVTSRSTRPRRASTATAAQAPLPQASVSPTPRSNTRRRIRSRATTWAKPTLADCANAGDCCSALP